MTKLKIAVVGSGVSGLTAAWALARNNQVSLFEKEDRLGGHSNTVTLNELGHIKIDTGFIVFNNENYPFLTSLFDFLAVDTEESNMSFAVSLDQGNFEYSAGVGQIFPSLMQNFSNSRYWRLLLGLIKFYLFNVQLTNKDKGHSISVFLRDKGFSDEFIHDHILPMCSAIWSSSVTDIERYSAEGFLSFFSNHGLTNALNRPSWRTVVGGSEQYVKALVKSADLDIIFGDEVTEVDVEGKKPLIRTHSGELREFDKVIMATHADQALSILSKPTQNFESIFSQFKYSENRAVLHCDTSVMPKNKKLWSSWNYIGSDLPLDKSEAVFVTYWMNRLQNISRGTDFFVTLNPKKRILKHKIFYQTVYQHPILDKEARAAAKDSVTVQGVKNLWFCGAYLGDGFHEDGVQAGLWVAKKMGATLPPEFPVRFTRLPDTYSC